MDCLIKKNNCIFAKNLHKNMNRGQSFLSNLTPVVKSLLMINAGVLLFGFILKQMQNIDLSFVIGLYYFESDFFRPFQIITHMFMHADFVHLFFNMYALWLFGQILERVWGGKRFFIYYIITGLGAAALHTFVNYIQIKSSIGGLSESELELVLNQGGEALRQQKNFVNARMAEINLLMNIPTVGASGAVFGILLAFGMLFPNTELFLFFVPVPIKAKYFVIGYGVLELVNGFANVSGDNIAHFAHLGGMLFGFILIKYWQKDEKNFY